MRIAILHEVSATLATIQGCSITSLAQLWQQAGHEVVHLFGPKSAVSADVIIVHVDLSVVPEEYLALARRYPVALNGRLADIRKRRISRQLLQRGDAHQGPVIVKSDLNFAGAPEHYAASQKRRWLFWKNTPRPIGLPNHLEYPVYASITEVPPAYWNNPGLVVEKFMPEREGNDYFLRQSFFLGDRHRSWRLRASRPVIRGSAYLDDVEIPTPPAVEQYRRKIGLDYGKIDFVEHNGTVTFLDVNKTVGGPAAPLTTNYLAPAIEAFFPRS